MKKIILFLSILFFVEKINAQTYTQTFIDKCTGQTRIATTTYINGNAHVSFYDQVRTFTPLEVQTGVLQAWLQATYAAYNSAACPVSQTVQQTVQNII